MCGMRSLVVIAHPLNTSLCATLAKTVVDRLMAGGHEVEVLDLYAEEFSPSLTASERASYYTDVFDRRALEREIEQLQRAQVLVLLFPTWWFGMPAMLKGWFDRVWAPGVAYDHASDLGSIKARLNNLRHTLAITTLGSPWWVDWFVLRLPIRRQLRYALLGTCAPQSSFRMLSLYKSEKLNSTTVQGFQEQIERAINRLK
jgi:NAD(P)H dehydrogenase (quinone)